MSLRPGLSARVRLVVGEDDTALALGSGDVPVLATPRLVALCEQATCEAVAAALEPGETTVGTKVELTHLVATPVGVLVTAEATLTAVDQRKLTFAVSAMGPAAPVAVGHVWRSVVDRERFVARAQTKVEERG
ncbi:MAG TPA: thioesterase [Acidimicrobiales bacterium]|nr:thioesterase [Acidimicrobiales bacterium]